MNLTKKKYLSRMNYKNSYAYILALLLITSCVKPKEKQDDLSTFLKLESGVLVLNEGLFQQNNSTLYWIDSATNEVTENVFLLKNDRLLGDTGNDMQRYGGKIYIVVNASSTVEILDATTLKSLKQIKMEYNGVAQQPRRIAFHANNAYVTSFDGYVNIIDTTSLQITTRLAAGENPEGVAVSNNYLYVANSGGLNFPNYDSTVYAYDLTTNELVKSYHVGANPGGVQAGNDGKIYVVKRGNYDDNPSELIQIDPTTEEVVNLEIPASSIRFKNDLLYISYMNSDTQTSNVASYDPNSQTIVNASLYNPATVTTFYGIYPKADGSFLILDAMGYTNTGFVRFYNTEGQLTKSINVGLNPNSIIWY